MKGSIACYCSWLQLATEVDMPSDAQRIQHVKALVDSGYSHRILLSQDMHSKHRLVSVYVTLTCDSFVMHFIYFSVTGASLSKPHTSK